MTPEEAKKELFRVTKEYMMNTPNKRVELYEDYQTKRNYIKQELRKYYAEQREKETKQK